jgi:hypothetical protein
MQPELVPGSDARGCSEVGVRPRAGVIDAESGR